MCCDYVSSFSILQVFFTLQTVEWVQPSVENLWNFARSPVYDLLYPENQVALNKSK